MIKIHRLQLKLPEGYEKRASSIIRLVSDELASIELNRTLEIDTMTVPCIEVGPDWTDGQVARRIAGSIRQSLMDREG